MVVFGGSYGIGADIAELAERTAPGLHLQPLQHRHPCRAPDDIADAARQVLGETGRVDYVVNTAGVLPARHAGRDQRGDHLLRHRVNYLRRCSSRRCSTRTCASTGGSLLLFTSSSYTRGRSGYSLYSSAKAATVNLTQALADEWAAHGSGSTASTPAHGDADAHQGLRRGAAGTLLESEAVARTSLDVLVSDFTGHVIDVRREIPTA